MHVSSAFSEESMFRVRLVDRCMFGCVFSEAVRIGYCY